MKKGFTLIELLVVVLIIGILSAIALPQYNFAVEKARATEALTVLGSVRQAEELYYMSNGAYTSDFEALDIQVPESKYWEWKLFPNKAIAAWRKNVDASKEYRFWFRFAHATEENVRNTVVCGYDDDAAAEYATRMCRALGATERADEEKPRWYLKH